MAGDSIVAEFCSLLRFIWKKADKLDVEEKVDGRWPCNRPNTPSYNSHTKRKPNGHRWLVYGGDMRVDFDCIEMPRILEGR